jgi:hypothetical protein
MNVIWTEDDLPATVVQPENAFLTGSEEEKSTTMIANNTIDSLFLVYRV